MDDRDEAERRTANLFDALAADYDASGVDFFQPIAAGLVDGARSHAGVSAGWTWAAGAAR